MRILMVNKFLYPKGGTETYMIKLGSQLVSMGHEVQYFGMNGKNRSVGNNLDAYVSEMDFHKGRLISKLFYPFKVIYSYEARRKIGHILNTFYPDVVHLNNFNYQLTPSIIVEIVKWRKKTNRKCRIIYTAHDGQLICPNHMLKNSQNNKVCEKCIKGEFYNCIIGRCIHGSVLKSVIGTLEAYYWKYRRVYQYLDVIICCSQFYKTKLENNRIMADKTVLLRNFIEKKPLNRVNKKDYVLFFGRYSEEKGVLTLIEACKVLKDIHFVFAGEGPLESAVNNVKNITNVGFKTDVELESIIREARFSVCPSEWYENCPFSVMESIAFGTPVIGANIGGIPELVKEGYNGELFVPGNMEDLKIKIRSLWNNKSKTNQYTNNCLNNDFDDLETYCNRIIKAYK